MCRVMEEREDDHNLQLPVFVFVLTKFKKIPNMQSVSRVSPQTAPLNMSQRMGRLMCLTPSYSLNHC